MDPEAFIEGYGSAIEAGQATVLIGAGLSVGAGYPSWDELLEPVAAEFGVPAMTDLPLRAQYIENQPGGRDRLSKDVAAAIGAVVPEPLENHILLAQLGIADCWTTNFDLLIETADSGLTVIACDDDLVERAGKQRRLCKMHGSIPHSAKEPVGGRDQLVLSRRDYERYELTHPRLWRLLQAQFLTSSFLFLGFSMTDPNFEAVFKIARLATADKLMPHYAIMKRSDGDGMFDFRAGELRQAGVELIEIADYPQVTTMLQKLVARTRPAGLFVSGSARAPGDAEATGTGTYPTVAGNEKLNRFAESLGRRLADEEVPSIVTAGELGAKVGYSFLSRLDCYDPSRFLLVRRRSDTDVDPPSLRQGQMQFVGQEPDMLRSAAFERVRAAVVLGGGPGTEHEAALAHELGMTVVPVAHTGGAALKIWQSMAEDLHGHRIGQREIDPQQFTSLASADFDTAMRAAVELIRVGLFLPRLEDR